MKHITLPTFHQRAVNLNLIGTGGTGSLVMSGLVRLHIAMLSLGHPGGLAVTAWDGDTVSAANIGRQLFAEDEIGMNKAEALVRRYNLGFGLNWRARNKNYAEMSREYSSCNVYISCVDSIRSRKEIARHIPQDRDNYWIDCGNGNNFGQVFIGCNTGEMPYPDKACPELFKGRDRERGPSCSLAEALETQELFINQWIATSALEMLWQLFRKGGLNHRGIYINLKTGTVNTIKIKPNGEKNETHKGN